jgi:hypothetical protein
LSASVVKRKGDAHTAKVGKTMAAGKEATVAFDDCEVCHNGCLIDSLACIAISAIAGCAPCGVVCLAAQTACHVNCNKSKACQTYQMEESQY